MTAAQQAAARLARHLRAGVAAAGQRWEDAGYVVDVAAARPGGFTLDAGYLGTVLAALADAGYMRRTVGRYCADCEHGPCPDHLEDREAAFRYDGLALRLRQEVAR
jgi:hypothetical protein